MTTECEIHLIFDNLPDEGQSSSDRAPQRTHQIPTGVSYLSIAAQGNWQLSQQTPDDDDAYVLQPIWGASQPRLLLIAADGRRPRINGREAPQLALLAEKDQFQPDARSVLHMAIYNRPQIGSPAAAQIGVACPICRTRLEADTRVYTCLYCGTALHLQGEETPPEDRLECALAVDECPVCHCHIEMNEGFRWNPERYCD